jgi:iron complex transport system substrate-binding protein
VSRYQEQKWRDNSQTAHFPVAIDAILDDPLLQDVDAVKNRRIFYTTAFCNWWPHQRAIVQVLYMAKIFHPDLFEALDVEKQGNAVFKRFYGKDSLYSEMARALELHSWN